MDQEIRTLPQPIGQSEGQLFDDEGPIPGYPPLRLDERGLLLPLTPGEHKVRSEIFRRAMAAIDALPDRDPPGSDEKFMRGVDSHRPEGCKLFEGYY